MTARIKLFAGLKQFLPPQAEGNAATCPIEPDTTVVSLLRRFGVPEDKTLMVLVNGVHADKECIVSEGDTVSVFPLVAGG